MNRRAVGIRGPSGAPPQPLDASGRGRDHRALGAGPLVAQAPSQSGPRDTEPADVSPASPCQGASPTPRAFPRGLPSGGSLVAPPGPPEKTGLGVGAAQGIPLPLRPRIYKWGN